MAFISVGTENSSSIDLYYEDHGSGPAVVLIHGYPLSGASWEKQTKALLAAGCRVITYDRRGFGKSSQPTTGYDYDTFAEDLRKVVTKLELRNFALVGFSMGGGEVARYIGRHGTARLSKAVLVGAVPPLMLRTASNPGGLPLETFDGFRASVTGDRSQYYKDLSVPFYGANRPGSKVSQGTLDMFWLWSMQVGLKAAYDCIKAFSETDQTEDLKRFDIPTLIIHGDDDQIVPIADSALLSSKLVKDATLKVYPGAPHGLMTTHKRQFNEDLLAFLRS